MFLPYENVIAEKPKRVRRKYRFNTVFIKNKDLRGQIKTKQKNRMETSVVVYQVDSNNCLKKCTYETGRKLKKMEEHKDDGEKSQKDKKITGLSQHMKTTGHSPVWDNIRIIEKITGKRESSKK